MDKTQEATLPSLREFVSAAILEIADGLHDAQDKGRNKGVKIYPNSYEDTSTPMDIEFDLSVRSIAQAGKSGGFKLEVLSIFGGNYAKGETSGVESTNRIRFTLPVNYVVHNIGQVRNTNDDWNRTAGKM